MTGGKTISLFKEMDSPANQKKTTHLTDINFVNSLVFMYLNNQPHFYCENNLILYITLNNNA